MEQALFGSLAYQYYVDEPSCEGQCVCLRDGFWIRGAQPRRTRVSAVFAGADLMPWRLRTGSPACGLIRGGPTAHGDRSLPNRYREQSGCDSYR